MFPSEAFRGEGVVLRMPRESDLDDVVSACNDPVVRRHTMPLGPDPFTAGHARIWLEQGVPAGWAAGEAHLLVADPDTDRVIGAVAVTGRRDGGHAATLDWWVAPWARGRGVAADSVRATAVWALANGLGRLEMLVEADNAKGNRVAAEAGFTHEGVRRAARPATANTWQNAVVWARLAGDPGEPAARALPDFPAGGLTDGVVTVTPMGPRDADDLYALLSLPDVVATTVASTLPTPELIARRCAEDGYHWLVGSRAECAIRDAATGAFAGEIGLMPEKPTGSAMIGYSVVPAWRGRGYAARATRLLADWAIDVAGYARVTAGAAPDNRGSRRTLERAGFREEGYERERLPAPLGGTERIDNVAYALLPADRG
jgi:RimJ/RimL family protein N-acetyltransferase